MAVLLKFSLLLTLFISFYASAIELAKGHDFDPDTADFFLLQVVDNSNQVTDALDAYKYKEQYFLALVPLLEALNIKYVRTANSFEINFLEKDLELELSSDLYTNPAWLQDDLYVYVSAKTLEETFNIQISIDTGLLKLVIAHHDFLFPYELIEANNEQRTVRNLNASSTPVTEQSRENLSITIPDEYRLFTLPNGYFQYELSGNNKKSTNNTTIQTVSDLAYHSTVLTWSQRGDAESAQLSMSRYPQYEGDKILGIWDTYTIGDIWTRSDDLSSLQNRGVGITFSANEAETNFENLTTSFVINAKPGWEADLFRNNQYISTATVSDDGTLEYNDLELVYGLNLFSIKLFGPFGEEEEIVKKVEVGKNSLSKGALSYNLTLQDNGKSILDVFKDGADLDTASLGFNYGVTDIWQLGLQLYGTDNGAGSTALSTTLGNRFTLPNLLLENNFNLDQQDNYSQITTAATSLLNNDSLKARYESSGILGEASDREIVDVEYTYFTQDYSSFTLSYDKIKSDNVNTEFLAGSYGTRLFNMNAAFELGTTDLENFKDGYTGSLSLSGKLVKDIRLTASIPFTYDKGEFDSVSPYVTFSYTFSDKFENRHNVRLINSSLFNNDEWALAYNLSIVRPTHLFQLRARVNDEQDWSVSAGISMYFGYDNFNNSFVLSRNNLSNSGSLNVRTYLDRNLNGIRDVLDHDLEGVSFIGSPYWNGSKSNENGQVRLIGAAEQTKLIASYKDGADTINQDFHIYTHPGSLSRVNLPFYLTTEIEFPVLLGVGDGFLPMSNLTLVAKNKSTDYEYSVETDSDGYAVFTNLLPGRYTLSLVPTELNEKQLTTDVLGYEFDTDMRGGYVELEPIVVSRSSGTGSGKMELQKVVLDESNSAPIIDPSNKKLIHLPPKGGFVSPHSLDDLDSAEFFFNEPVKPSTQSKQDFVEKVEKALKEAKKRDLPVQKAVKTNINEESAYILYKTDYNSLKLARSDAIAQGLVQPIVKQFLNNKGKLTYGFQLAGFSSQEDAEQFVIDNNINQVAYRIEKERFFTTNTKKGTLVDNKATQLDMSQGWVVQFSARSSYIPNTFDDDLNRLSVVDELHVVTKSLNQKQWYCLISKVFANKQQAQQFINDNKVSGFVVEATHYQDVVWSK